LWVANFTVYIWLVWCGLCLFCPVWPLYGVLSDVWGVSGISVPQGVLNRLDRILGTCIQLVYLVILCGEKCLDKKLCGGYTGYMWLI